MADEELKIIIKGVDEYSHVVKDIERQTEKSSRVIKDSVDSANSSFNRQVTSLIAVGNAANAADRIQSSYQNLQLRLENASERVASAQDRLRNAQYKLNKVQQDGEASAEDLANAQQEVESASRSLTISQNNQQRAMNQALGTYISMGVQSLQLMQSLSALRKEYQMFNTVMSLGLSILNPTTLVIGGLVTAIGVGLYSAHKNATASTEAFNTAQQLLIPTIDTVNNSTESQIAKMQSYIVSLELARSGVFKLIAAEVEAEQLRRKVGAMTGAEARSTSKDLAPKMDFDENLINAAYAQVALGKLEAEKTSTVDTALLEAQALAAKTGGTASRDSQGRIAYKYSGSAHAIKKVNDAIITPGGKVIETDPNDYLIATKTPGDLGNGGGLNLYIYGDIYGAEARDISKALYNELRKKISI